MLAGRRGLFALALVLAPVLALGLGGCRDEGTRRLSISAAASLTEVFSDLAARFEAEHEGVKVELAFAGSQILRVQIEAGAPFDIYASAHPEHMAALARAGLVEAPQKLASNHLVLAVPREAPARIETFADLTKAERIVLGTPAVPAGRYAREVLERAEETLGRSFTEAVRARVVSEETNVRQVRAKLELGEVDAALIYRTDALASDRVRAIELPPDLDVGIDYLVAAAAQPRAPGLARAWLELLASDRGRARLEAHGFAVRP